jgi:hypothetical protein
MLQANNHGADSRTTANPGTCIDTAVSGDYDLSGAKGGAFAFTLLDKQGQLQIFTAKPDGSELDAPLKQRRSFVVAGWHQEPVQHGAKRP